MRKRYIYKNLYNICIYIIYNILISKTKEKQNFINLRQLISESQINLIIKGNNTQPILNNQSIRLYNSSLNGGEYQD